MAQNANPAQVDRVAEIAALNDEYRKALPYPGRNIAVLTPGIQALVGDAREWPAFNRLATLLRAVRDFNEFTPDNDPHGEHDFGSFEWEGTRCIWKFDYFDPSMNWHSEDAANPDATIRVLTIMRADEY